MPQQEYFFPALFLVPEFEGEVVTEGVRFITRKWQVSTFDLATLSLSPHKLHLSYQLMDVFLGRCNGEIAISDAASREEACAKLEAVKFAMYMNGCGAFISPFVTTHSVNEYSGINSRDGSESLRKKLHPDQQTGLTSDNSCVEAWPHDVQLTCMGMPHAYSISSTMFRRAVADSRLWSALGKKYDQVAALSEAALSAALISPATQSQLHIWTGLEGLFAGINAELSFRLALFITQLVESGARRREYYRRVKKAYNLRSRIAHGTTQSITYKEWEESWNILLDVARAILKRGSPPSEDALLADLFA